MIGLTFSPQASVPALPAVLMNFTNKKLFITVMCVRFSDLPPALRSRGFTPAYTHTSLLPFGSGTFQLMEPSPFLKFYISILSISSIIVKGFVQFISPLIEVGDFLHILVKRVLLLLEYVFIVMICGIIDVL